jgi:hypothetical protein
MTTDKHQICDNFDNWKTQFDYPDFPEKIKQCIIETIENNLSRCLDPVKAKGQCLRVSDELMLNLADQGLRPFVECKIVHTRQPKPHFWVYINGWHIDLTAKQFDPQEPCPKILKDDEVNVENLFVVKKGRGKVLYKLVPFQEKSVFVFEIKRIARLLKINKMWSNVKTAYSIISSLKLKKILE